MRFGVLGPLSLTDDEDLSVALGGAAQRRLLACLLCAANRVVTVEALIDDLWGAAPPPSARQSLRVHLHHLRRVRGIGERLIRQSTGRMLVVAPGELDSAEFDRLSENGRQLLAGGEAGAAAKVLRAGLDLWRGEAYQDIEAGAAIRVEAQRLTDLRLIAQEDYFDAELALAGGGRSGLVAELRAALTAHPMRERLRGQLMLALHRGGWQAEAFVIYDQGRRLLADELGVDPSAELRDLYLAMVRGAAMPGAAVPGAAMPGAVAAPSMATLAVSGVAGRAAVPAGLPPAQLPAGTATFAGRSEELKCLDELTASPERMAIVVLCGPAGVGKTALALQWSQRNRHLFPDGQLFVNLRGYDADEPPQPEAVLAGFLRALGVPAERIPLGLDDAAALFRTTVAGRRLLAVLDNAASAVQVRRILPGTSTCCVLITSRDRLSGLVAREGARRLDLEVLSVDDALALLTAQLGPQRVGAEPEAAADLARVCGRLPLALCIAASELADHPQRSIASQHAALSGADRLDRLEIPDDPASAVRSAVRLSYERLSGDCQAALRLFGLVGCPDLTAEAAAAALGIQPETGEELFRRLFSASLVEVGYGQRYGCHDLIRIYAQELAAATTADEGAACVRRLLAYYLTLAGQADQVLFPSPRRTGQPSDVFVDQAQASSWFDAECANLLALQAEAARRDWREPTWRLAAALRHYLRRQHRMGDWMASLQLGLAAADGAGDHNAVGAMHDALADLHYQARRWQTAHDHWTAAADAYHAAGDELLWATCHDNLGIVSQQLGDNAAAERHHLEALAVPFYANESGRAASCHIHLGIVYGATGRYDRCHEALDRALALSIAIESWELACYAHHNLAELGVVTGDAALAQHHATEEVRIAVGCRIPLREARGRHLLGDVAETDDPAEATAQWHAALAIYEQLGHPDAEDLRGRLVRPATVNSRPHRGASVESG